MIFNHNFIIYDTECKSMSFVVSKWCISRRLFVEQMRTYELTKIRFKMIFITKDGSFEIWTKCLFGNYYNFRIVISVNRFNYYQFYNNWYRTLQSLKRNFIHTEKLRSNEFQFTWSYFQCFKTMNYLFSNLF